MELLRITVITLIQIVVFTLLGFWALSAAGWAGRGKTAEIQGTSGRRYSIAEAYVTGFAAAFCIFEVFALPCIFLSIPTHIVGYLTGAAGLASAAAGMVSLRRNKCAEDYSPGALYRRHGIFLVIPAFLICFFCLWQILYKESSVDAMYYINLSSTAVFKDRMAQYNAYTGAKLYRFSARYVFNTFPYYSSAISCLTGVRTVIISRTVLPILSVLASILAYYRLGCEMFRKKGKKYADIFLLFAMLLLFRGSSQYLPGSFFLNRLYEGKAMIANVTVPLLLLCGAELWNKESSFRAGLQLFLCSGAAVCFAGSCVICLAGVPAVVLPAAIKDRAPRKLLAAAAGILPVVCWCACYYLSSKGVIPLKIHRR